MRISENLNVFLISLAVAFVAWVFAKAEQTEEAKLIVPVTVVSREPGLEIRVSPSTIPVRIRYPKDMQADISSENFHFEVDTGDLRQGLGMEWKSKTQPLTEGDWVANVPKPGRLRVLKIGTQSNTVEVKMRWDAKPAIVEPQIVGEDRLDAGMQLVTPVKITPREVWVAGDPEVLASIPRDDLTSKMKLRTEAINVAEMRASTLETVAIQLPKAVRLIQPATKLAEVNIEIQEVRTVTEIKGVKLEFSAVAPDAVVMKYQPKTASVTVKGPVSLLKQLKPESFEVALLRPAEEVPGETKEVPLEVRFGSQLSEDVRSRLSIQSVEPNKLTISYEARPSEPKVAPQ